MIDRDLLISACYRKHERLADLAKFMGIEKETLSKRITTGSFSRSEIAQICSHLDLSKKEKDAIFFSDLR